MKTVSLWLWRWRRDQTKYILKMSRDLPFTDSPTMLSEWYVDRVISAGSPLTRPIPEEYALYFAEQRESFPYNTTDISIVEDLFNPKGNGVFFISKVPFTL